MSPLYPEASAGPPGSTGPVGADRAGRGPGGTSLSQTSAEGTDRERDTLCHSRAKPQSEETKEQELVIMSKKFGMKGTREPRGDLRAVPTRSPGLKAFPHRALV